MKKKKRKRKKIIIHRKEKKTNNKATEGDVYFVCHVEGIQSQNKDKFLRNELLLDVQNMIIYAS